MKRFYRLLSIVTVISILIAIGLSSNIFAIASDLTDFSTIMTEENRTNWEELAGSSISWDGDIMTATLPKDAAVAYSVPYRQLDISFYMKIHETPPTFGDWGLSLALGLKGPGSFQGGDQIVTFFTIGSLITESYTGGAWSFVKTGVTHSLGDKNIYDGEYHLYSIKMVDSETSGKYNLTISVDGISLGTMEIDAVPTESAKFSIISPYEDLVVSIYAENESNNDPSSEESSSEAEYSSSEDVSSSEPVSSSDITSSETEYSSSVEISSGDNELSDESESPGDYNIILYLLALMVISIFIISFYINRKSYN